MEAVDAKTGKLLFILDARVPIFSSMATAHGAIYAGTFDGKLKAFDLTSQKPAWEFQIDASKQRLQELSLPDGTFDWSKTIESRFPHILYEDMIIGVRRQSSLGATLSSPVFVGNTFCVGSTAGNLYALE